MSFSPAPEALLRHPFPVAVREVAETLQRAGFAAYLVGGSVRDLLLGRPVEDYDLATDARAERVQALFRRVIPTGLQHGTVTVIQRGLPIEVTTFRGEGAYGDGRRPDEVRFLDDVEADLARRDFTINAMAFDPTEGRFVDPFGGVADLARHTLRCVGEARVRFSEDGLRPLRAVRFAATLGFSIEPATLAAIPETLDTFAKVASERVREELTKLLEGAWAGAGLSTLRATGLLARALPETSALEEPFETTVARVEALPPRFTLRLAGLLRRAGPGLETALKRLRLPRKASDEIAALVREADFGQADYPDDVSLRRSLARVGRQAAAPLLLLARAEGASGVDALEARIAAVLASNPPLAVGELALGGDDVIVLLGAEAGPQVGAALRWLLDRTLEEPSRNTPETLARLLLNRLRDTSIPGRNT